MRTWPAPAKLNLFLHVTGRRADGYHRLQTVFQFLDFGDELGFVVTDDGRIARAAPVPGVTEENDLTLCAARLLKKSRGVTKGVLIHLTKRLPIGGGLGGGSSDAATTLLALNELWGVHLPIPELATLGLKLGADVPVFIHGHAAWAEGIGEVLTPVEPEEAWYVGGAPARPAVRGGHGAGGGTGGRSDAGPHGRSTGMCGVQICREQIWTAH